MILEEDTRKLAQDKKLAIHRLLQSITRMDYQCFNKPIRWKDQSGEHTGIYHPMDLMHFLIKNLDILSRGKLYQKLSICKMALPVLFLNKGQLYMDRSLHQVEITWLRKGHLIEGARTNALIFLISMMHCGQQSIESFSKSKLENGLFRFKCYSDFGSCGFFTKHSLSSNNLRQAAKGTAEGMWFESTSNYDKFPASFGLLNLRGDAVQCIQTATTLASCSDLVFMFCNVDMFKEDRYKILQRETSEKLKLKDDGDKKINKLVVVFTKHAYHKTKENRTLFQNISKSVSWEIVRKDYQRLLNSVNCIIQESLKKTSVDSITTLNVHLRQENKESTSANNESARSISDSFIKIMDMIKNADKDQRSVLRESLFPLQSTTKYYPQTQRKEKRSFNIDEEKKLAIELIFIRRKRYEKIRKGLPETMSSFLKKLFDSTTVDQEVMFVFNMQHNLNEWCSKYLFNIRMQYLDSLRKLVSLKDKETERKLKPIDGQT